MSTIIAADIGGTNCRLGLFETSASGILTRKIVWVSSESMADTADFIKLLEEKLEIRLAEGDALVAAIAGPVLGDGRGRLSNGKMEIDFGPYRGRYGNISFSLINDFTAQAHAALDHANGRRIGGPAEPSEDGRRAIIGAGTGLGYASMAFSDGRWLILPSENGHAPFPFLNEDELRFGNFLCKKLNRPFARGDDVLAGRGLETLHLYLSGEKRQASRIGESELSRDSLTLRWYSRFYARACSAWMLATLCAGGLWISGGIAARNPLCVENEFFTKELYADSRWSDFLRDIPIYLLEDNNSGLHGAARLGAELCDNVGRLWGQPCLFATN